MLRSKFKLAGKLLIMSIILLLEFEVLLNTRLYPKVRPAERCALGLNECAHPY